jgi:dUTP pyrophosphatase
VRGLTDASGGQPPPDTTGPTSTVEAGPDRVVLRVHRLDPGLPLPSYAHPGDAGADLRSRVDVTLAPGQRTLVPTGLAIALPEGYAGFTHPRSGLAARHGITIVNTPGLVDSGYRGELKVILLNTDAAEPFVVEPGMRIAQLVVLPVPALELVEVDELGGSERGARGFGSSRSA